MTPEPCGARRPQISLSVVSPPSSPTVVAMPKTEMSRFPIHDDLPRHSAERIGLAVAAHYDSKPGLQLHTRTGRQAGIGIDEVARAQRWDSADPREAALLRYVRPLLTDGKFPQHLHEEAREAGWSDEQLLEAIAVLSMESFTAMVNVAGEVPVDGSFEETRVLRA